MDQNTTIESIQSETSLMPTTVNSHFLTVSEFNLDPLIISGQTSPNASVEIQFNVNQVINSYFKNADYNGNFNFTKTDMVNGNPNFSFENVGSISIISYDNNTQEKIENILYNNSEVLSAPIMKPTSIYSNITPVTFASVNSGDIFMTGYSNGYQVEVEINGHVINARTDETGNFYLELPWSLSNGEQFAIYIYDSNQTLVETIPVKVKDSVADVEPPQTPIIEQPMIEGQATISGYSEPNTLVLLKSSFNDSIIIPVDSNGYYYYEFSKPLEVEDYLTIFAVDLANNVSEVGIEKIIEMNPERPKTPLIAQAKIEGLNVKGQGEPNLTIVLQRMIGKKIEYLQTITDNNGYFSISLTRPLGAGEQLIFYGAHIYSFNNIILSQPTSIQITE